MPGPPLFACRVRRQRVRYSLEQVPSLLLVVRERAGGKEHASDELRLARVAAAVPAVIQVDEIPRLGIYLDVHQLALGALRRVEVREVVLLGLFQQFDDVAVLGLEVDGLEEESKRLDELAQAPERSSGVLDEGAHDLEGARGDAKLHVCLGEQPLRSSGHLASN